MKTRLLFLILLLTLAACAGEGGDDAPVRAVENYLQAKVDGDEDALAGLLCSAMEADLTREAASFASVQARLEDVACERDGDDVVRCTGQITATYGTEDRGFPLTAYRVVQEDGEWKWCGEAG